MSEMEKLNSMSSKDKEMLYKRVCELNAGRKLPDCLSRIDTEKNTYYEEIKNPYEGIREYSISSVSMLRRELQILWGDTELEDLIPNIIAAAFKSRERLEMEIKVTETQYEEELPYYIYNF